MDGFKSLMAFAKVHPSFDQVKDILLPLEKIVDSFSRVERSRPISCPRRIAATMKSFDGRFRDPLATLPNCDDLYKNSTINDIFAAYRKTSDFRNCL